MTLRRPKKPGSRRHVERTEAQETAFRVFRLRGLYWMLHALTGPRLRAAKHLVDAELAMLGAETETDRRLRRVRQAEAERASEAVSRHTQSEELPF